MTAAAPTAEPLTKLREQYESLALRAELQQLERIVKAEELSSRLIESEWGSLVDRREYLHDTPGWGRAYSRIATSGDRVRGQSFPVFENEQDLQEIVGIGRYIAAETEIGVGAIESLINYTLGTGFEYLVEPLDEDDGDTALVREVQRAIDEILEGNQWTGDKETDSFVRAHRDGECFRWAKDEGGFPLIVTPEPSYVTEPQQVRELEEYLGTSGFVWSFGIATRENCHDRPHAYFFKWDGDWDVAPAAEVSHIKLNVDRGVKRGVSDFFPSNMTVEQAVKLFRNVMQGSAVQASIAYIKEHAVGTTGEQITTARNTRATNIRQESTQAGTVRTIYGEKFAPGRVVETVGTKYHAGPLGQPSHPLYITVIQAALRMIGLRWSMPEYMVSADASNANYASTLVAGSPFIRATERRQAFHKRHNEELLWKCLAVYVRRGRFPGVFTLAELKRAVQLKIEAPSAAISNRLEEESIRDKQQAAGILSKKTRAAQSNLDFEIEQANIAEQTPAAPPLVLPKQAALAGALESVRTKAEAIAVLSECYP